RKAEKEQQVQPEPESAEPVAEEDPKKAAVAAAIARAKARKAAKEARNRI
ncbi:hypothetical protein VINI7043_00447, partial [Vibrio nigripulchritudo ATCC 27043]